MALFFDGMNCSLCNSPMQSDQQLFGTWGVWLPSSDRLWRFCDAMLHWDCYAEWKYRNRFAQSYFEFWIEHEKRNPYWWRVYRDDSIFITANPSPPIESIWVHLAETGTRHSVSFDEWADWLTADRDPTMHGVELQALTRAKRTLRREIPTAEQLLARIDPNSKSELMEAQRREADRQAESASQKRGRMEVRNRACARFVEQIRQEGLACPNCGTFSHDYRLSARDGYPSLVICRSCGDVAEPPAT